MAMQVEEGGSRREVKSREAAQRLELRSRLAGLPQPENEYSTVMPELPDAEEGGEGIEEDAADLAARKKREAAAREAIKLKKRSQVDFDLHPVCFPTHPPTPCLSWVNGAMKLSVESSARIYLQWILPWLC